MLVEFLLLVEYMKQQDPTSAKESFSTPNAVIAIPPSYSLENREALIVAAENSGIKVSFLLLEVLVLK